MDGHFGINVENSTHAIIISSASVSETPSDTTGVDAPDVTVFYNYYSTIEITL